MDIIISFVGFGNKIPESVGCKKGIKEKSIALRMTEGSYDDDDSWEGLNNNIDDVKLMKPQQLVKLYIRVFCEVLLHVILSLNKKSSFSNIAPVY